MPHSQKSDLEQLRGKKQMTGMLEKSLRTMASATSSRILKPLQQSTTKLLMLGESGNARNNGTSTSKGAWAALPAKAASRLNFGQQDMQAVLPYESREMLSNMAMAPGDVGKARLGKPARGKAVQVDYMMPKPFDTGRSPAASPSKPNTSRGATSSENRYLL